MPDFEKPGDYSREAYDKTADSEAKLRAEIAAAAASGSTKDILALGAQLQVLEAEKNKMTGQAQEEAGAEDAERDATKKREKNVADAMAARQRVREEAAYAEKQRLQQVEDEARIEEVRVKINGDEGGVIPEVQSSEIIGSQGEGEGNIENIYGMSKKELGELLASNGNTVVGPEKNGIEGGEIRAAFGKKFNEARNKLIDRVVGGEANEEETTLAVEHFKNAAKTYNIASGDGGMFPHKIFLSDTLIDAVSQTENPEVRALNRHYAESMREKLKGKM